MHREHDPTEWTDWTARLFPVGTDSNGQSHQSADLKPEKTGHHHHHEPHDPEEPARARQARRNLQDRLAQVIFLLILAELSIWLTGLP